VILALLALTACGGAPGVRATRADGSRIELGQSRAWCGAYDPASGAAGQPRALHALVGRLPQPEPVGSYLLVSRRLDDLRRGRVVRLPDDAELGTAFVFDAKTRNEVASNLQGATGSVRFRAVSCTPGAKIRVRLDAVLVSENGGGEPVHVRGDLRARIGAK
jgi:hypothetical protein